MAEEKSAEKAEKKKLPIMLILSVLAGLVNFGVLGMGVYWTYSATIGFESPKITEDLIAKERERLAQDMGKDYGPLIYTMDKFTVNLSGDPLKGDPKRSIQVEVNLEMLNKDGFEELINVDNRARARDKIISILNAKTFHDLETIQGKLFLKDQLATEINSFLDKGVVKDVYFSQFVVQ